jgi:hypothetical protein
MESELRMVNTHSHWICSVKGKGAGNLFERLYHWDLGLYFVI